MYVYLPKSKFLVIREKKGAVPEYAVKADRLWIMLTFNN